jgi:hypothetical protein
MPLLMNGAESFGADLDFFGRREDFYVSVGCADCYFEARDMFRLGLCMSVVDSLLLLVVAPFYWPLIGIGH